MNILSVNSFLRVSAATILFLIPLWSGRTACAQNYSAQSFRGWPGHDGVTDLAAAFSTPPAGYGNVPFYWWTGDPLDMERLRQQLEILSDASTSGLCVSYNHTHKDVEVELNAPGHGPCGRVSGGKPRVMSEQWWDVWNEFSALCAKKGIGLGMDDYVIAWPRNGEFIDSILAEPSFRSYQGQLGMVKAGRKDAVPENVLAVVSRTRDSVSYVCTCAAPWLHPDFGNRIVQCYFKPFTDHMDADALQGMNYFFQDELQYGLSLTSWCEDMREQFRRRKGYDIVPHLADLFIEDPAAVSAASARVRLDYAEVLTQLAEERYFKPIYDWNASKGLIYGCDPEGRGLRPTKYLDYFRAISWFTAPGNDAPARGSSFRQTKVSSSIAHLYGRPRTWLEAFHSMGWDANGALLKHQLDHHIIAGGNLLCMHGLYYSTHGGWWEWAPPCFHFRMPYWPHMKLWLRYAERMCFLLSQGSHVCDIAILYPTETMQAVPGTKPALTFAVSDSLSVHALDYDFIDYQSVQKAEISGKALNVAGESYKVLVLADAAAMHGETLAAVRKFIRKGGHVIAVGKVLPQLRRAGVTVLGDVSGIVEAVRRAVAASCGATDFSVAPAGAAGSVVASAGAAGSVDADFSMAPAGAAGRGRVLHRRAFGRDVYMVMDVAPGDVMSFRCCGKTERWNAMDGSVEPLPVLSQADGVTSIRYDGPADGSMLVVFSPGEPVYEGARKPSAEQSAVHLDGNWDVDIIPTLDNRWGDFRLPASDGMIGVEAREMQYCYIGSGNSGMLESYAFPGNQETHERCSRLCPLDGKAVYGYGPYMTTCTVDPSLDIDSLLEHLASADRTQSSAPATASDSSLNPAPVLDPALVPASAPDMALDTLRWKPYVWSWQYGVPDSPGSQGWHGLKARVNPRFLILDQGGHQLFRTNVIVPQDGTYRVISEGAVPYCILLDGRKVALDNNGTGGAAVRSCGSAGDGAAGTSLFLGKGRHSLIVAYAGTRRTKYSLRRMRGEGLDKRDRGMVVFYPEGSAGPVEHDMYDSIVASKWYGTDVLAYEPSEASGEWLYSFHTAPGAKFMSLVCNGLVKSVYIDGIACSVPVSEDGKLVVGLPGDSAGISTVKAVDLPGDSAGISTVNVVGVPREGCPGAAFFAGPVKFECGRGKMPEGDWTQFGAMAYFSGAVRYSRSVELGCGRLVLDLGEVDATCEVSVNGCTPVVLIGKPYSLDITPYVHPGRNDISVLVYSSLSNHYSTIPSPYRGTPRAGLIGPVRIIGMK